MAIVGGEGGAPPPTNPGMASGDHYVAYRNYLAEAVELTDGGNPDAEFPLANAATWAPYEVWKSTETAAAHAIRIELDVPRPASAIGLYAHNFATAGVEVQLQGSTDDVVWSDITLPEIPPSDGPYLRIFPEVTFRWYRLYFPTLAGIAPQAGLAFIGPSLKLWRAPTVGFTPPLLSARPGVLNNRARAGGFLGRSVQREWGQTGFTISHVPVSWARNSFEPFLAHARLEPFLYGWDTVDFPDDTAFGFTDGEVPSPDYSAVNYIRVGLQFVALTS